MQVAQALNGTFPMNVSTNVDIHFGNVTQMVRLRTQPPRMRWPLTPRADLQ
jgi:hypothetical protein